MKQVNYNISFYLLVAVDTKDSDRLTRLFKIHYIPHTVVVKKSDRNMTTFKIIVDGFKKAGLINEIINSL